MKRIVLTTTLTLTTALPFVLRGADYDENPNRFSFGPRFGLNFKANFNNNAVNPGPATGGANHFYNDGYVLLDGSGDAGGLTSNWGYPNASQVVGNSMQFHAIQSDASSSPSDDPQFGAELVYQRVLGSLSPALSGCWGLETGFGFTHIDLRDNQSGNVSATTDSYSLNGVLPPAAGYNGTPNGPGALLGDTPTRTATPGTLTTHDKLAGQLFSFRLGPFVEWHFSSKLSLSGSAGLTLAPTTLDYDFSENASLSGGGNFAASGHACKTELLYGPYVGGTLRYDFDKCLSAFVGAQFQNLTALDMSVNGRSARFDPGAAIYLSAGIGWKF